MEELIKQAFIQVEKLGPHVQEGRYDLTGPDGEIILPSVWEKVIQPDWQIVMTMWPIPDEPPPMDPRFAQFAGGKHGRRPGPPPMPTHIGGGMKRPGVGIKIPAPPEGWPPRGAGLPEGVKIVNAEPSSKKERKKTTSAWGTFLTGSSGKKPKKK
jgi:hypothetical protein